MGMTFEKDFSFDFSKLDAFISDLTANTLHNASIAVVYKDKMVFRKCYGFCDYEDTVPSGEDDLYFIYSASKVITCTAVMRLVEEGRLSLDDELAKYIPEFSHMMIKDGKTGKLYDATKPITIENLFSMMAGLTYDFNDPALADYINSHPDATTLDIIKNGIAKMNLIFEPGENFNYSLCHDVLAGVAEIITGMRFGDYVKKVIFEPLDMSDSSYGLRCDNTRRIVAQFESRGGNDKVPTSGNRYIFNSNYDSGGAGVVTSVNDYISLVSALCDSGTAKNGAHILSRESIDNMRKNRLIHENQKNGFWKPGYGYGLGVRTLIDKSTSKGPLGEFGWDGAAGAYTFVDVDNRLCAYFGTAVIGCEKAFSCQPFLRDMIYEALGLAK